MPPHSKLLRVARRNIPLARHGRITSFPTRKREPAPLTTDGTTGWGWGRLPRRIIRLSLILLHVLGDLVLRSSSIIQPIFQLRRRLRRWILHIVMRFILEVLDEIVVVAVKSRSLHAVVNQANKIIVNLDQWDDIMTLGSVHAQLFTAGERR